MVEKNKNGHADSSGTNEMNGNGTKDLFTKATFPGKLLILGCGAIGQGIIPMILRHTDMTPERMKIISADDRGKQTADHFGIEFMVSPLTTENYATILKKHLRKGDVLLNLSVDVASTDLLVVCQKLGVLYFDTSAEQWPGFSSDPSVPIAERTSYFRTTGKIHELKRMYTSGATAVVNHGANPGLISHLIKEALLNIARDTNRPTDIPKNKTG